MYNNNNESHQNSLKHLTMNANIDMYMRKEKRQS